MTDRQDANNAGRRRFVALDRDGTITAELKRPITHAADLELLPGAVDGLRQMTDLGLRLLIITNQSGVGRGTLAQSQLDSVHSHLVQMLVQQGIKIQGVFVCPHAPDEGCQCRKPRPGLLEQAASELAFRPSDCFLIGDKISDLECGKSFGAATVLVRTGYGAEMETKAAMTADNIADDLCDAAKVIASIIQEEGMV